MKGSSRPGTLSYAFFGIREKESVFMGQDTSTDRLTARKPKTKKNLTQSRLPPSSLTPETMADRQGTSL
jgi:hypothetical protein